MPKAFQPGPGNPPKKLATYMQLLCGLFALAGPGGLLKLVILFGDFFSTNFFHSELGIYFSEVFFEIPQVAYSELEKMKFLLGIP